MDSPNAFPKDTASWRHYTTYAVIGAAIVSSLALGFAKLGAQDLWHDELVHVFVARNIAQEGRAALPSGMFYPSSLAYNYLLGGVVALWGDAASTVRMPSVLFSAINVLLSYLLFRKLLGREAALLTALFLALSPWQVAWARQARMYQMQQSAYLLMLLGAWGAFESGERRHAMRYAALAVFGYLLGVFSSYHSILSLGTVGAYAAFLVCCGWEAQRGRIPGITQASGEASHRWLTRGLAALGICLLLGIITLAVLTLNPNPMDRAAVFESGLGGRFPDPQRMLRWYYMRWLWENLSAGFLILALAGAVLAPWREGRRGLFVSFGFWMPVLVLTFLIGYRRDRFMFFVFPCHVALFSYALCCLLKQIAQFRRSWAHAFAALLLTLFSARLALSTARLTLDAIETSRGGQTTLAVHHQQWAQPCAYVREHAGDAAILSTTALCALYHAGRVDQWFPNRFTWWEYQESGLKGLANLEELKAFVQEHPYGYFIADRERFEKWRFHDHLPELNEEVTWVEENMERINAVCTPDVSLFKWKSPY